jgi:hypothetical protein
MCLLARVCSSVVNLLSKIGVKSDMANLNYPGTLEFAVRDAMDKLGADRVAAVLGTSSSILYKSTGPNPTRKLPTIVFSAAVELARLIKSQRRRGRGKTPDKVEHFSAIFRAVGRSQVVKSLDLNGSMTWATAEVGRFAKVLYEATHKPHGSDTITSDELAELAKIGRNAMRAISQTVAVAEYRVKQQRGEAVVLELDTGQD